MLETYSVDLGAALNSTDKLSNLKPGEWKVEEHAALRCCYNNTFKLITPVKEISKIIPTEAKIVEIDDFLVGASYVNKLEIKDPKLMTTVFESSIRFAGLNFNYNVVDKESKPVIAVRRVVHGWGSAGGAQHIVAIKGTDITPYEKIVHSYGSKLLKKRYETYVKGIIDYRDSVEFVGDDFDIGVAIYKNGVCPRIPDIPATFGKDIKFAGDDAEVDICEVSPPKYQYPLKHSEIFADFILKDINNGGNAELRVVQLEDVRNGSRRLQTWSDGLCNLNVLTLKPDFAGNYYFPTRIFNGQTVYELPKYQELIINGRSREDIQTSLENIMSKI